MLMYLGVGAVRVVRVSQYGVSSLFQLPILLQHILQRDNLFGTFCSHCARNKGAQQLEFKCRDALNGVSTVASFRGISLYQTDLVFILMK